MGLIVVLLIAVIAYFFIIKTKKPSITVSLINDIKPEIQVTSEIQTPNQNNKAYELESVGLYYFPVESTPRKINVQLKMHYVNTHGDKTERVIDVKAFYRGENGCLFEGFDYLRNSYRKLSSKCVKEAIDTETGETLDDVFAFFEKKYQGSPDYLYDYIFDKHGSEIYIFIYLAAADGAVRAPERRVIANYCIEQEGFNTLNLEKFEELLKNIYRPSKYDFHQYTRKTEFNPKMWDVANEIVNTNTQPHSEQTRALEYILKQWKPKIFTVKGT